MPSNNPIAGVVTSQPVQHYVNRDDSSLESVIIELLLDLP